MPRPTLASWRRMSALERYYAYSRWSLLATLLVLLPAAGSVARNWAWAWGAPGLILVAMGALNVLIACVVIDGRPGLRAVPRPTHPAWQRAGLALGGATWAGGLAGVLVAEGRPRLAGIAAAFLALVVLALAYLPWMRRGWWILAGTEVVTGAVLAPYLEGSGQVLTLLVIPPALSGAVAATLWSVRLMEEAHSARLLAAELSASRERIRIAQELHDTMGQNMAAMSLRTEIVLALAQRGDERLVPELLALRELMQRSTTQMRQVVHGYRSINLASEVASARSLLESAGVTVEVDGGSLDVPEPHRELAAWFLREAATNVLRHATAATAELRLSPRGVVLTNDGAPDAPAALSGLEQLRRRAADSRARLVVTHDAPRFTVSLVLDAVGTTRDAPTAAPDPGAPA